MLQQANTHKHIGTTRQLLWHWGRWYNRLLVNHLSKGTQSLLGHIVTCQGDVIKSTNHYHVIDDQEAELVDSLLNQLKHHKPKQALVLKAHYSQDGTTAEKIKSLQLARRSYYYYLKQGEQWLHNQI